jgi:hypothetical protein
MRPQQRWPNWLKSARRCLGWLSSHISRDLNCNVYLRKGIVYLPTMGKMSKGFYRGVEPVAVVSVANVGDLRKALAAMIVRGNPRVPMLRRREWRPPILLNYAGVKYWSAFERGMCFWSLERRDGIFQIAVQMRHPDRMWRDDPDQLVAFPPGASTDEVVDRMVAILQDVARKPS